MRSRWFLGNGPGRACADLSRLDERPDAEAKRRAGARPDALRAYVADAPRAGRRR